jgi:hypothetical protein
MKLAKELAAVELVLLVSTASGYTIGVVRQVEGEVATRVVRVETCLSVE